MNIADELREEETGNVFKKGSLPIGRVVFLPDEDERYKRLEGIISLLKTKLEKRDAEVKMLIEALPADDCEGATLEWYAAKFENKLGHALFGQRLRNYAALVRLVKAG